MSNKNIKKNLIGYVSNSEFNEKIIPIPFQNILLRNYCKENNFNYFLPYNETVFKNSSSQLITLINKLDKNTNIIACSIFMLPESENKIKKILKILISKKSYIFFLYENLYLKTLDDYESIIFEKKIKNLNKLFFNDSEFKRYIRNLIHKS